MRPLLKVRLALTVLATITWPAIFVDAAATGREKIVYSVMMLVFLLDVLGDVSAHYVARREAREEEEAADDEDESGEFAIRNPADVAIIDDLQARLYSAWRRELSLHLAICQGGIDPRLSEDEVHARSLATVRDMREALMDGRRA